MSKQHQCFRRLCRVLGLMLFSCSVSAAVYQRQDQQGLTVFSDVPTANATAVQLPALQLYHSKSQMQAAALASAETVVVNPPRITAYQSVTITNVSNQATIRNANTLPQAIEVSIVPSLQAGDKAVLYVDGLAFGTPVVGPTKNVSFNILGVVRGEHQLQIKILRINSGQVLAESKSITQFFQQNNIHLLQQHKDS